MKNLIFHTVNIFYSIYLSIMIKYITEIDNLLLERFRWSESHDEMMLWARLSILLEIVRRSAVRCIFY